MDAGVPCTSRTPLSSKSAVNINCVQAEKEATGLGFKGVKHAIARHVPQMIIMECVTQLASKSEGGKSDAEHVCDVLRGMGYWCHTDALLASEFGAF
eukprot:9911840-Lingulodinium_polyedra.AAC.1